MKKLICTAMMALMTSTVFAAPAPTLVEVFACNLKPGKTMADLDNATAYFNSQADAAGLKTYFAATLTPLRANVPYDVIWVGSYPDLTTFANEETALTDKGVTARINAQFDAVVSCASGLHFSTELHDGLPQEEGDNESVIQFFGCDFKDGKGPADLTAADQAFVAAAGTASFLTVQWMPYLANAPFDVAYLSVFDDLKAMAAFDSTYYTSKAGMAAEAEFAKVVNCKSGLFAGKRVRTPAMPAQ